jgi:hypothetical protein
MNATDLSDLDGKIVLVSSARDHRNPPTAVRGTIRVREERPGAVPIVQIEIDFPQMFTTRAHHRTITLGSDEVAQLQTNNCDGTFSLTLSEQLDPEAPPSNQ